MTSKWFTQLHSTVVIVTVIGTFLSSSIHPSFSAHDVYVDVLRGKGCEMRRVGSWDFGESSPMNEIFSMEGWLFLLQRRGERGAWELTREVLASSDTCILIIRVQHWKFSDMFELIRSASSSVLSTGLRESSLRSIGEILNTFSWWEEIILEALEQASISSDTHVYLGTVPIGCWYINLLTGDDSFG